MIGYIMGLLGMWLIADGEVSLVMYWNKQGQSFYKDHLIRVIRVAIGITLIIFGAISL